MGKISIELMGGIGNQLFQYFAGLHFAQKLQIELELIEPIKSLHKKQHKLSNIRDFDFAMDHKWGMDSFFIKHYSINRIFFWMSQKSSILARSISMFGYVTEGAITRCQLKRLNGNSIYLKGYFQTYKYFTEITQEAKKISIVNPSPWFQLMLEDIRNHAYIALHVRRGDYQVVGNEMGALSVKYYEEALSKLDKVGHPILIFSDDVQAAKKMFVPILGARGLYVDPPSDASAAESLILMSLCKAIITANSTFSYWAALLSKSETPVVYPNPWFFGKQYSVPEIPDTWISANSNFEGYRNNL
jgi:hypothetical protein